MPIYYVDKNAQPSGTHEIHRSTCDFLPDPSNRRRIGSYSACYQAIRKAKQKYYSQVDGCKHCSRRCHKG